MDNPRVRGAMEEYRKNLIDKQVSDFSEKVKKGDENKKKIDFFDIEEPMGIVKWESQDYLEIEVKNFELSNLEDSLAHKELDLVTFQGELHAFEMKYLRIVGIYFAELDEIRANVSEVLAQHNLEDENLQEEAERARTQARESAEASEAASSARHSISAPFKPSAEIKVLFREIAKRIHPDLARDEEDNLRRHQFMAEANKAYRGGDESRLKAIIREWEESLKSVSTDVAIRLQQIIKKIFQIKERLRVINETIKKIQSSDLYKLRNKAEEEERKGEDLFSKISEQLKSEIIQERARLREILQRNSYR